MRRQKRQCSIRLHAFARNDALIVIKQTICQRVGERVVDRNDIAHIELHEIVDLSDRVAGCEDNVMPGERNRVCGHA